MLNCRQATQLMSLRMDRKLGVRQKLGLRLHLMMCSGCRNFDRQMDFLRRGLRRFTQRDG